ncbi:MAG: hypothetical protein FWD72_02035 [Eggerthellaceae bacterium]|nr:hypothetical protein [Eggerthellaceae bacterium]
MAGALAAAVLVVALFLLCSARIADVNAGYPPHGKVVYSKGEDVPFPAPAGNGGTEAVDGAAIRVTEEDIFSLDNVLVAYPDYSSPVLQSGQAHDMRLVVVSTTVRNDSENDEQLFFGQAVLQSGAWFNGIDQPLFSLLNGGAGVSQTLKPHEEESVLLPFCMYDVQFGFHDTWASIDHQSFELVLATYPDKVSIELGTPGVGQSIGGIAHAAQ